MRLDRIAAQLLSEEGEELYAGLYADKSAYWKDLDYDGPCSLIDADRTEALADVLMRFIAEVVVTIVDAGSERDAVIENEALRGEILKELKGWDSTEWRKERAHRGSAHY